MAKNIQLSSKRDNIHRLCLFCDSSSKNGNFYLPVSKRGQCQNIANSFIDSFSIDTAKFVMNFFLMLIITFLMAPSLFAENKMMVCIIHSDCEVGCANHSVRTNCLLKSQIKIKASKDHIDCKESIGGLECGCKESSCSYMLPQDKNNSLKNF